MLIRPETIFHPPRRRWARVFLFPASRGRGTSVSGGTRLLKQGQTEWRDSPTPIVIRRRVKSDTRPGNKDNCAAYPDVAQRMPEDHFIPSHEAQSQPPSDCPWSPRFRIPDGEETKLTEPLSKLSTFRPRPRHNNHRSALLASLPIL